MNLVKATLQYLGESPEDREPASPDELSMATKQLSFIEYAARELEEYLKTGGEFPEWMQNKLSNVHDDIRSLHSYMGDHGNDMYESIDESHFKHGESVKCIASGMEGEVIDVGNPEEDEKYYTVRRNDGQVMKYAPDELESLEEINESKMPSEKEINKAIAKTKTKSQAVDILMKKFKMSKDEAELIMQSMMEEGGAGEEGTDELTKKYKKDTPMEEVVVEKTADQAGAFEDGKKAARKGKKYKDNPHKKGTDLHLWWSKGHNKVRESVMDMSSKKKKKEESNKVDGRTRTFKEKLKKLGYKKTVKEDLDELLGLDERRRDDDDSERSDDTWTVMDGNKIFRIKGKAIQGPKARVSKAIDTLKQKPFNKNKKFSMTNTIRMESAEIDESLRKDIAKLSSKFPEGSKVRCNKSGKTGKVLTVGKDFVKVAVDGGKVMDYNPSDLTPIKE